MEHARENLIGERQQLEEKKKIIVKDSTILSSTFHASEDFARDLDNGTHVRITSVSTAQSFVNKLPLKYLITGTKAFLIESTGRIICLHKNGSSCYHVFTSSK